MLVTDDGEEEEVRFRGDPLDLVVEEWSAGVEGRSLDHPLAQRPYAGATEGAWFAWTKGALGLRLPALTPALSDVEAKRRFWRAFRSLRDLALESLRKTRN
jgi:hypothetical protein